MSELSTKSREELTVMTPLFDLVESTMGFVPNSMLTMAHWPELLTAFGGLGATILQSGELEPELKQLIALISSRAYGCNYCQAHTAHSAHRMGTDLEKIAAVFEFEASKLFSERERAALRFSWCASLQPNAVEHDDLEALKSCFSEREIVEITAVVSLFGFLNRWNDSLATALEPMAAEFADGALGAAGWSRGKH